MVLAVERRDQQIGVALEASVVELEAGGGDAARGAVSPVLGVAALAERPRRGATDEAGAFGIEPKRVGPLKQMALRELSLRDRRLGAVDEAPEQAELELPCVVLREPMREL